MPVHCQDREPQKGSHFLEKEGWQSSLKTMSYKIREVINCGLTRWMLDRQENGKRRRSFFETREAAEAAAREPAAIRPPTSAPAAFAIRKVINNGQPRWVLDRQEAGERRRSFFNSKVEAEAAAAQLRATGLDNRNAFLSLDPSTREQVMAAVVRALDAGHDLSAVVAAIDSKPVPSTMPVGDALTRFLEHLRAEGRSHDYISSCRQFLGTLVAGRESKPLSVIDKDSLMAWLEGREGWTRSTMRNRARAWMRYAVREDWIAEDPTDKIPGVRIVSRTPPILSVAQHEAALRYLEANPRGLAWYVLSSICGLRPAEAEAMTWDNILLDTAEPVVRVDACTSKVRSRRAVYLDAHAAAWLRHARALKSELPLGWQARRRILRRLREVLGWEKWPQDITRHTAASYRLAAERNAAAVAEALGHSVAMLERHYKAVVTREQAAAFFAVLPTPAANTVKVNFHPAPVASRHESPLEVSGDAARNQGVRVASQAQD